MDKMEKTTEKKKGFVRRKRDSSRNLPTFSRRLV